MLDSGSRRSRRSRISGMVSQIGRHRRRDTEFRSARVILFEVLEQRVLLSGDPLSSTALATQPVLYTALTTSTSDASQPQVDVSTQADASSLDPLIAPPAPILQSSSDANASLSAAITADALAPVAAAAAQRLESLGLSSSQLDTLNNAVFQVSDLPGWTLGLTGPDGTITIDADAAGYGWFVDPTPQDSSEFNLDPGKGQFSADANGPAAQRIDLLTVVEHEMGHLLGAQHSDQGVMEKGLAPGERRDASAGDLGASPSPVTGPGETIAAVPSDRMLQITPTATWIHNGDGFWDDKNNWSTGAVPGVNDDVLLGGTGTVTIRSDQSVRSLLSNQPLALTAGTLTLAASSEIDGSLQLSGGSILSNGSLAITGTTTWLSGDIGAAGTGSVTNSGQMTLQGSSGHGAVGTFNNSGTITVTGSGAFVVGATKLTDTASTTTNLAAGTINLQSTGAFAVGNNSGITTHVLSNAGTIRKSVAAGNATVLLNGLTNSGTIDVQTGTLTFNGGSTTQHLTSNGGAFTVASGATVDLTGSSTVTVKGAFGASGLGTIRIANGSLVVDPAGASFNFAGTMLQWTGGDIRGTGVGLTNLGNLTLAGANDKLLGAVLTNSGTIEHNGGTFQLDEVVGQTGFTGIVNNTGLYELNADNIGLFHNFADNAAFNNSGTFRKTTGTGSNSTGNVPFNNLGGVIDVASGTLIIASGTHTGGAFKTASPGGVQSVIKFTGSHTITGIYVGSGSGLVQLAGSSSGQVVVTQHLDDDLDLSTFQLGSFGFGRMNFDIPAGRQVYTTRIDDRANTGVFVDLNAELDVPTRTVTWTFTSIDPETLTLPADPLEGFLPPDTTAPEGEGYVTYTVAPKSGRATGTTIDAQASIVFDLNAPIATDLFTNTIDAGPPASVVAPLGVSRPQRYGLIRSEMSRIWLRVPNRR
jgi:hypothetical protein